VAIGSDPPRTHADLRRDAYAVARALTDLPAGDVLLVADDRYYFAAGLLGAWLSGRAVRLPPNVQDATIRELEHVPGTACFVHDRKDVSRGIDLTGVISASPPDTDLPDIDAHRLLATLMTSGTTGPNAPCPKTAGQLLGEVEVLASTFAPWRAPVFAATVPPHHIYGLLFGILLPLRVGGAFLRESPLQPEALVAALARWRATILVSVPAHLAALEVTDGAPQLDRVFSSGAPLAATTSAMLASRFGWRVTEIYGSSETGGIAWREECEAPWQPFAGVAVTTTDDGCLALASPRLSPDGPRPWICPDRIAMRPDGTFSLLGRADGVLKVGAKRVALSEIEERLRSLPGVGDVALAAHELPGLRGHEVLVAAVATGWTVAGLRRALAAWLDPVTIPRRIRIVSELPREASGKLTRRRLLDLFASDDACPARPSSIDPEREVTSLHENGTETRHLSLAVPKDLVHFDGHFDGHPVLPGVAQLDMVLRQARRAWPDMGVPERILRLKFKKLIRPGDRLELFLIRNARAGRFDFEIRSESGSCASGTIVSRPG
jgi:acyl-coenzyme A synthetase/AMP-(fatty) acid ligase